MTFKAIIIVNKFTVHNDIWLNYNIKKFYYYAYPIFANNFLLYNHPWFNVYLKMLPQFHLDQLHVGVLLNSFKKIKYVFDSWHITNSICFKIKFKFSND